MRFRDINTGLLLSSEREETVALLKQNPNLVPYEPPYNDKEQGDSSLKTDRPKGRKKKKEA